jgi:ERCC4-related helicase
LKKKNEQMEALKQERSVAQEEAEKGAYLRGQMVTGKRKDMLQVMASQEADEPQQVASKFKKWPKQSEQQLDFDIAVVMFLVSCNLPFTLVECQGFKNFMNYLCPRAHVKTRNAMSQWKLDLVHENLKIDVDEVLKKDLKNCSQMALTTDCWTAKNQDPYMSLTLHYITDSFQLEAINLGCELFDVRHTCKNSKFFLNRLKSEKSFFYR